ncbi:MAG: class I SAM-dependent methyltransferase [Betaproteobacteria bacterium]
MHLVRLALVACSLVAASAWSQSDYTPFVGQPGKDVIWVPTPYALVEKMLDMAKVTSQDYVIDLGSGDGRNIIAAAKRGARALGVEWEKEMVELSRRYAKEEGVGERARFVQGDMFEADISQASVLALFLLPANLEKLRDKFLALQPGSRIVSNGYQIPGWQPDETEESSGDCGNWCTAYLYHVPAKVEGNWRLGDASFEIEQKLNVLDGSFAWRGVTTPLAEGRVRGFELSFTAGGESYTGRIEGDIMRGTKGGAKQPWTATRVPNWQ